MGTKRKRKTTYLVPPSTGECRRLSGTLVLALGLNDALPVGFCDEALPDALLPVDTELTVEAIRLSGGQSKRTHVVEQHTTPGCAIIRKVEKRKRKEKVRSERKSHRLATHAHRPSTPPTPRRSRRMKRG